MLRFLRALPIRRKLTVLLLAPCVVTLLMAGAVLIAFQLVTFRQNFERDLITTAEIVAHNAAAAVAFRQTDAAEEVLRSLRVKEHVVTAVLVTPEQPQFARYGRASTDPAMAVNRAARQAVFTGGHLLVSMPVILEGKRIATLHVLSDYRGVYIAMLKLVACILVLVGLMASAVAMLLSSRLQRFVSDPVVRLTETASKIADKADYSVRAHEERGDEFGVLTRAFNQMLGRIETQDAELQRASQRLAKQVTELQHEIAEREKAERELEETHRQLVAASRQAGMAEVAAGVLHNVGNVLNSVNVSVNLLSERLRRLRSDQLGKVAEMIRDHGPDLAQFLTADAKGRLVPQFIMTFSAHLGQEQKEWLKEMSQLASNIEHIKEIVAMQQSYARVAGVLEDLPVASLIEDALRLQAGAFARDRVKVVREFTEVPPVRVDKHKVLQILINLFRNAKHAMDEASPPEKVLSISVANGGGRVKVRVRDNGVGIPAENLTRVFQHGFTTKRDGHGFGLHSGALAAREMQGSLIAASEGPGTGATFTLELPAASKD